MHFGCNAARAPFLVYVPVAGRPSLRFQAGFFFFSSYPLHSSVCLPLKCHEFACRPHWATWWNVFSILSFPAFQLNWHERVHCLMVHAGGNEPFADNRICRWISFLFSFGYSPIIDNCFWMRAGGGEGGGDTTPYPTIPKWLS